MGAYSAPPDPLARFGGLLLREGEGTRGEEREGKGRGGRGGKGKKDGRGMRGGEERGGEGTVPTVHVLRNDHCRQHYR